MGIFNDFKYSWQAFMRTWNNRRDDEKACEDAPTISEARSKQYLMGNVKWGIENSNLLKVLPDGEAKMLFKHFKYAEVASFVVSLFCDLTGKDRDRFGIIYLQNRRIDSYGDLEYLYTSGKLIVPPEWSEEFEAWLANYKKNFDEDYDFETCLPEVRDGRKVTGTFVNHNLEYKIENRTRDEDNPFPKLPEDDLYDEWKWVLGQCNGSVRITDTQWMFEDDGDAMMYQLLHR